MTIPKNKTMKSCVGMRAVTDCEIRNLYGVIAPGTEVDITGSSSYGMKIKTLPCSCCGISLLVTNVGRSQLSLCENGGN